MAVALLVAAGRGESLGVERAKAFVMLAGRPMLEWSVEALSRVPAVSEIVIALPPGEEAVPGTRGVPGGPVRSASVRAALAAAGPGDHVVVHDAARPLAAPALFERTIEEVEEEGVDGAVAAVPVTDTIKEVDDAVRVTRTLERTRLWAIQTPQSFRRSTLERALDVPDDVLAAASDDAWLVERAGGRVHVVPGAQDNLKVTTAADLRAAELALAERPVRG